MTFSNQQEMTKKNVLVLQEEVGRIKAELAKDFHVDLTTVSQAAREFRIADERRLEELAARIEELVEQLQSMLGELRERAHFTLTSDEAVRLAGTAHALEADIEALLALLERVEAELEARQSPASTFIGGAVQATKRVISKLARILKPILRSVSAHLWRLLVGLLTPKEWSIKGSIGTPVLGLAQAELEITFGPSSPSGGTP